MALKVRESGKASSRFATRAAAALPEYLEGTAAAGNEWLQGTVEGEANFAAGVTAAVASKAFSRGARKAGAASFVDGTQKKGATRFPQGVAEAGPDWEKGVKPFLDTVAGLTLPKRGRRGDPANLQRVAMVANALHAKKVAMSGGS